MRIPVAYFTESPVLFSSHDAEPATALEAFRWARPKPAERTPGLDDRLRFMVEILANGDPRLEPVLTQLACMRPGRSG